MFQSKYTKFNNLVMVGIDALRETPEAYDHLEYRNLYIVLGHNTAHDNLTSKRVKLLWPKAHLVREGIEALTFVYDEKHPYPPLIGNTLYHMSNSIYYVSDWLFRKVKP